MNVSEACIYCNSINHKKWIQVNDSYNTTYGIAECKTCGLFFLSPQPSKIQLAKAYDESYYGEGDKKFNPLVEKVVDWFRSRNAKQFATKLPAKAKVLDIGCGNGSFLQHLGKHGEFELHGLELPGKAAERASKLKLIQLHLGALESVAFSANYFDAIVLTHVFEHLPNPKEILKIIHHISAPNAILQLEIPNIDSWQARIFKSNWLHLDPPRHLHFFRPKQLKNELHKFGFTCVEEHYFSPQFSPFGAQQSILNVFLKKREVLYEYLKGNSHYAAEYSSTQLFFQKLFHWLSFPLFVSTDFIASLCSKGATVKLLFRKRN